MTKKPLKKTIDRVRGLFVRPEISDSISLKEAMQITGFSKYFILRLSIEGDIPCHKIARKFVYSRKELTEWIEPLPLTRPDKLPLTRPKKKGAWR
jgi:hypothetical protein